MQSIFCALLAETLRAGYERDMLVASSTGKGMTFSLVQSLSRSPTREQAAAVMAELAAILTSDSFSSSKRCRDFLEFVVKRALAGGYESLTERFLGFELFVSP